MPYGICLHRLHESRYLVPLGPFLPVAMQYHAILCNPRNTVPRASTHFSLLLCSHADPIANGRRYVQCIDLSPVPTQPFTYRAHLQDKVVAALQARSIRSPFKRYPACPGHGAAPHARRQDAPSSLRPMLPRCPLRHAAGAVTLSLSRSHCPRRRSPSATARMNMPPRSTARGSCLRAAR